MAVISLFEAFTDEIDRNHCLKKIKFGDSIDIDLFNSLKMKDV